MVAAELFNTYRSYAQNTHTIEIIINNVEYKILVIASRKYNYTSNTKLGLCCHQCTKCGVIFGVKSTFVPNSCGSPFYYGKCSTCTGTKINWFN
jgi:hypothetical protein